uniref:Mitochondrial sodium/hydrogen exchanger 9B2 n=1 Tax=Cacopsylla melanoneura TaxID=428564 RepID=A0A8D8QW68_9HEMI
MDNNQKSSILPPGQTRTPTIVTQNNSSKMPRPEDIDLRNKLLPTIAGSEFQNSTPQREKKPPSRIRAILTEPCGPKNLYILRLAGWLLCLFISWGLLYTLLHDEVAPGGQLLSLLTLIVSAHIAGLIVEQLGLPPLLGMLLTGIILRNIHFFEVSGTYREIVVVTREVALTVILIKAGLGLDAKALKKLSFVVIKLAFVPCIIEAAGAALCCYLVLGMTWEWGFLMGFALSAVSPAVVVPTLLKLSEGGYGESKGISTMVIAASSLDDIVAISAFGIFLGFATDAGENDVVAQIIHAPLEIGLGTAFGVIWGLISSWLPHKEDKFVVFKRVFMIGGGGLFSVLGSQMIGYTGAGPLSCIIAAFVACLCWKWQGWSDSYNPVATAFSGLWLVLQPALFGLIGAEIDLSQVDITQIGHGLVILVGGLVFRAVACTACLFGTNLNWKEMIFVNIAWLPKATVQAALGSVALDIVLARGAPPKDSVEYPLYMQEVSFGRSVLTIAVLSILVTAPLGAVGIAFSGTRLLSIEPSKEKNHQPSSPQIAASIDHLDV